jgi:hypothetical protein
MSESPQSVFGRISGRGVVVAMFSMGILATGFLWAYWTVQMTPFMPLQEVLESEFPKSRPQVKGGTIKKSGDTVLKVVLQTDFNPRSDSEAVQAKIKARLDRTRELASELADLPSYSILAMHLYFPMKEQGISQKTFFRDVATCAELDEENVIGWESDPARVKQSEDASSSSAASQ